MEPLKRGQNGTEHLNLRFPSTGTPVNGVKSAGTLTVAVQPLAGDTFTIGTKVYTFVTDETAATDGQVDVGADLADAKVQIVAAINGTDHNTASAFVTAAAFATNDCVVTAITGGVAGDLIATTETFDNVGNIFDAVTLGTTTAGVDGTGGTEGEALIDASYLYYCTAEDNTFNNANWVRAAVSTY